MLASIVLGSFVAFSPNGCKKTDDTRPQKKTQKSAADSKDTSPKPAKPPSSTIHGEVVTYQSGDVTMKGYLAYDKSKQGKRPGVLVVHEWWGHNEYTRRRARMLAKLGYTALAVDMYGDGKQAAHPGDAKKFMEEVTSNLPGGVKRFEAAKSLLEAHATTDAAKTAAIGYCFGGAVVLHMARIGLDLKAVASFHGNLSALTKPEKGGIKAKVAVYHGAADPLVPPEQVAAFKEEMKSLGVSYDFVAYAGAKHAFTNPEATAKGKKFKFPALEYNAAADAQSWTAAKAFLAGAFAQ